MARHISKPGAVLLFGLFLGAVWAGDGIYRLVSNPDEKAAIDDASFNVSLDSVSEPVTEIAPDGSTLIIQEAGTSLLGGSDAPEGFTTVPQDEAAIHSGKLLQLDGSHAFSGNTGELGTFENKNDSYRMKRLDLTAKSEVVTAMNSMGSAYQSAVGAANLMVYSTTAPYDAVGSLYPDALPDRVSGYCVDLCLLNADETISRFETPNTWLQENSWKYGFVFSYTDTDAAVTGVAAAPYHLRYVGQVHAGIMHDQNLTLSGYFEYLKSHTLSVPLYYTVDDVIYTVYYVPSEGGTTEVPVPLNADYEISGNNTDGYIITVAAKL